MRQIIALLLLSLYLFTSTNLGELLKLPQLVEHYKDHQKIQEEITFTKFIHQHYAHGDVDDDDRDQDMKLPYKSIDITFATSFTVLPTITSIEFIKSTDFIALKSPVSFYAVSFSSDNFSSIWQPPKIV